MTATHDQLQAIPDRVTRLEADVNRLEHAYVQLVKQVAGLRQQQATLARLAAMDTP